MKKLLLITSVAMLLALNTINVVAQEEADPVKVELIFRNTTDAPVFFRFVDDSEVESPDDTSKINFIPVDAEYPLKPGDERTYESMSDLSWEVVQGGQPLAIYVGDDRPEQVVDIRELASWQRKVSIIFQNDSEEPVDIFWTSPEGIQTLIIDDLPPGVENAEPVPSLPNQLWTIEQNDSFFADYIPDNELDQVVSLKELKTWFEPVEVTFTTSTSESLHVYFVDLDGDEILYTKKENGRFDPLTRDKPMIQPARPLQKWLIKNKQRNQVIAEYIVTNEKKQVVEITDEILNSGN